jgi:hypothetical protein
MPRGLGTPVLTLQGSGKAEIVLDVGQGLGKVEIVLDGAQGSGEVKIVP